MFDHFQKTDTFLVLFLSSAISADIPNIHVSLIQGPVC